MNVSKETYDLAKQLAKWVKSSNFNRLEFEECQDKAEEVLCSFDKEEAKRDIILKLLSKEINSINVPTGAVSVSEDLLQQLNDNLRYRNKLIQLREEIEGEQ